MTGTATARRLGLTIPFVSRPMDEQREIVERAAALGYSDLWTSETAEADAFTPLALASAWAPDLRLGTAIVPVYTRGPATLAMSFGTLAQAAPGRFVGGIGASSPAIVSDWNGLEFERPWHRVRDTLRFLRAALAGERVSETYETFAVEGFRLGYPPAEPPPLYVAALREGMLRLAGREGDGAILNWLSPADVRRVAPIVREFGAEKEIVARIFVAPGEDEERIRTQAKRYIAAYLNVPGYAAFHQWLGRADALRDMWEAWAAGDRKRALAAIDDELVDELFVFGSPARCWERIQEYADAGVTTPVLMLMPWAMSESEGLETLGAVPTAARIDPTPTNKQEERS
jgi:probable F420-dependent oxidoreductase